VILDYHLIIKFSWYIAFPRIRLVSKRVAESRFRGKHIFVDILMPLLENKQQFVHFHTQILDMRDLFIEGLVNAVFEKRTNW